MPKPNNLADIFSLLSQDVAQEKNHFLFLLGTDTYFTQRPTITLEDREQKKTYERGETLSYAAQAIVSLLNEQAEVDKSGEPLSYSSPSVDVVNGPTTLGTEVGKRIAQGVFLALRAVASGKETLEIAAHSRGAVEAIMVMNELARIKKALVEYPSKSLRDILYEAPAAYEDNTYIAAAMKDLFQAPDNETPQLRIQLLSRLNKLKINSFLMDPVPGGSKFGIKSIGWRSPRFYEKPACDNSELLLFRDERTCCFTPIVPEGMQALVLPGHHGSASGNRYNQQGVEVSEEFQNRDTTTIQNLVLCKLFYFLNQSTGGRFNQQFYQELNLEHEQLDTVLNQFLGADELTRRQLILNHYTEVQKNDAAFRSLANGAYAWLGARYTQDKQRFVHYRGHNHSSMSNVAPTFNDTFLNEEHALLFLRKYIDFDSLEGSSLDQMVSKTTITLGKTIQALLSPAEGNEDGEVQSLLQLLQNPEGAKLLFSGLSLLVDTIGQKYLRNNLTQEEDQNLRSVIAEPFRILKEAKERLKRDETTPEVNRGYINQFADIIETGLKRTVETHYHSIIDQTDYLYVQMSYLLTPPEQYYTMLQDFIKIHLAQDERFAAVQAKLSELTEEKVTSINDIQTVISLTLESFAEDLSGEIKETISAKANAFLQPCIEAHQTSIDEYFKNIERLYDLSSTLSADLPSLGHLLSEKRIEAEQKDLEYRMSYLIKIGGYLLKEQNIDLRTKPEYLSESFFMLLKREAIKQGAISPEMEELQTENQLLSEQLKIQQLTLEEQQARFNAHAQKLEQEKQTEATENSRLLATNRSLQETMEEQNKKLVSLAQKLENGRATQNASLLQKQGLINQLNSAKERNQTVLISTKLLPFTIDYQSELFASAKKYLPDLMESEDCTLPDMEEDPENPAKKVEYDKIAEKYAIVTNLRNSLEDSNALALPSARVQSFQTTLHQANVQLALIAHRDGRWERFAKACFTALAITLTGIIPGAIGLLAYSAYSGKSLPLFFNYHSRGENYLQKCNAALPSFDTAEEISPFDDSPHTVEVYNP